MAEQISILRLRKETLPDLASLFLKVFGVRHELSFLQWKYETPGLGAAYMGFLAYDPYRQPVAFCGGIPCRLAFQSNVIKGLQFCDTMTLPAWRGKGLFGQLATRLEQLALEQDIKFHFALLNQDSFWAYQKKLNWQIVGEMRRYAVPVFTFPLQKLGQYLPFLQNQSKKYTQAYLARVATTTQLPNALRTEGKLSVIHDDIFFKYKLRDDHFLLNLEEGQVWIKLQGGIWIGDCCWNKEINPKGFIRQLKQIGTRIGAHRLHFQFTKNTVLEEQMSTYMSSLPSWKIGAKSFDPQFPVSELAMTLGDIDTF